MSVVLGRLGLDMSHVSEFVLCACLVGSGATIMMSGPFA